MKERIFKIALESLKSDKPLRSLKDKRDIILEMIDGIKKKEEEIKNKKDFLDIMKEKNITDKDLVDIIHNEIEKGNKISDFLVYLSEGDKGIGLVPKSWLDRNIDDAELKKIPRIHWNLIKNKQWLKDFEKRIL